MARAKGVTLAHFAEIVSVVDQRKPHVGAGHTKQALHRRAPSYDAQRHVLAVAPVTRAKERSQTDGVEKRHATQVDQHVCRLSSKSGTNLVLEPRCAPDVEDAFRSNLRGTIHCGYDNVKLVLHGTPPQGPEAIPYRWDYPTRRGVTQNL
jgi:hypothetical protein